MLLQKICTYFNKVQQNCADKKAFHQEYNRFEEAVRQQNVETIAQLKDGIFGSRFYNYMKQQDLIEETLKTDNVGILQTVLNGRSPNLWIYHSYSAGPEGPLHTRKHYLLTQALKQRKENISTFLAQHPDIDVMAGGYRETVTYRNGNRSRKTEKDNLPLVEAKIAGFQNVVNILADKMKTAALTADKSTP